MAKKFVRFAASMLLGGAAGLAGQSVLAQVQPATAEQAQPAAREYHPSDTPGSIGSVGYYYPTRELMALPPARAQASAAAAEYRRAQAALDNSIQNIRLNFVHSQEVKDAQAEEKAAYEQLQAASEHALADLKRDDTYLAAVDLKSRLGEQIIFEREQQHPRVERLVALSTAKLSYSASATAMEAAAIAADPAVKSARQRLMAAGQRLGDLREKFADAVRTSPDVLAARTHLEDTRTAMLATSALYSEAADVASLGLDYAYDTYYRPAPYVINTPYYGGYTPGYVGGSGYQIGYPLFQYSAFGTSMTIGSDHRRTR